MFPVMALGKAAVTYFVFVDDLPLVMGTGILEHDTIDCGMIVGSSIFGAPCTPRFIGLG